MRSAALGGRAHVVNVPEHVVVVEPRLPPLEMQELAACGSACGAQTAHWGQHCTSEHFVGKSMSFDFTVAFYKSDTSGRENGKSPTLALRRGSLATAGPRAAPRCRSGAGGVARPLPDPPAPVATTSARAGVAPEA